MLLMVFWLLLSNDGAKHNLQRQPILIVSCIIIIPPRLTYKATARRLFIKNSTAVEADYILTENTIYTDLPL